MILPQDSSEMWIDLAKKMCQYCDKLELMVAPFTKIQTIIKDQCPEEYFTLIMRRFMMQIDLFADIAHEVGALLFVDMAHIAGLVAAGLHQNPVEYADVVSTTTHKTLRGPRGGMILTNDEEIAKKINKAVFPGTQGGPLMHVIAAKAVCFGEALKPEFKEYQQQVVKNAKALAAALVEEGFDLLTGGTDNHLMLVDQL